MTSRLARWCLCVSLLVTLAGSPACKPDNREPITYAVTISDVAVEPAVVTTETPVVVKFNLACNRTSGHTNIPFVKVAVEARRGDVRIGSVDLQCRAKPPQSWTSMPWVGEGQIELGKLPAGKEVIILVVPAPAAGWAMPAPKNLTLEVLEKAK